MYVILSVPEDWLLSDLLGNILGNGSFFVFNNVLGSCL